MMNVRILRQHEWEEAASLVWETFLLFEAPEYGSEGVETFRKFITDSDNLRALKIYGAFDGQRLCGVAATRKAGSHISLLFVRKEFHGRGAGRMLIERIRKDAPEGRLTVHSSPYAVGFYRRMGFEATASEQLEDGIRFIPMVWSSR